MADFSTPLELFEIYLEQAGISVSDPFNLSQELRAVMSSIQSKNLGQSGYILEEALKLSAVIDGKTAIAFAGRIGDVNGGFESLTMAEAMTEAFPERYYLARDTPMNQALSNEYSRFLGSSEYFSLNPGEQLIELR